VAGLYHTRRMFGGGLHQVWPFAAIALHYLDGFEARFRQSVETSERVISTLASEGFEVDASSNGTNIFRLRPAASIHRCIATARRRRLTARPPGSQWMTLQVNETWARVPARKSRAFPKSPGLVARAVAVSACEKLAGDPLAGSEKDRLPPLIRSRS